MVKRYYLQIILLFILISCIKDKYNYPYKFHKSEIFSLKNVSDNQIPDTIKIFPAAKNLYPLSGTISHHLLVSPIIDKWFLQLKKLRNEINTFFIISPKHYELSNNIISLSSLDWKIEDNKIKTNKKYIKKILNYMEISENRFAFHNEHGIGTLLPFIKKYYPKAKIVPIVMDEFKKQIGICSTLAEVISLIMEKDKNTFLLISIDFSHKGDRKLTDKRDKINKDVLNSLNADKINNAYSDNNVGLFTLFNTCSKLKLKNNYIFCHTDSEKISNKKSNDITSYFFTFQY